MFKKLRYRGKGLLVIDSTTGEVTRLRGGNDQEVVEEMEVRGLIDSDRGISEADWKALQKLHQR